MLITNLSYTRRRPVEQYGYEELSASAALTEMDTPSQCANDLRNFINGVVFTDASPVKSFEQQKPVPKNEGMIKVETEAPVVQDKKKAKPKGVKVSSETTISPIVKPEPEQMTLPLVENAAPKANKKHTIYDRNSETHKDEFKTVLDKVCPHWRDLKGKAKDLSIELAEEKIAFLDENGNVLASFEEKVREYMA
jgi:hypothetical protein